MVAYRSCWVPVLLPLRGSIERHCAAGLIFDFLVLFACFSKLFLFYKYCLLMMKNISSQYSAKLRAMLRTVLILSILITAPSLLIAQPPPPDDPNSVPIDGGLSLLLGAGAAAAAWKYRKRPEGKG
jgi:NhaP-type Na+/H+ or K+/H+ antiporter